MPIKRTVLGVVACLPALGILLGIWYFGVDSPHYDEWHCEGRMDRAYLAGEPLLPALLQFCNECRPVLPKLVWLATSIATHNSPKADMYIGWLVVCLTAWNLFQIAGRNLALTAIVNAILFHPVQHENWLWGSQNMLFVPALVLTALWRVLHSERLSERARVIWCGLLPVLAAYSFTNGLLVWGALFGVAGLGTRRWSRGAWTLWLGMFAITVPAYFIGFERAPVTPFEGWSSAVQYVAVFLGAPLARNSEFAAACVTLTLLVGIAMLRPRTISVWVLMIGYALASAALAAYGRSGMGIHQALDTRYVGLSCWLLAGFAGLAGLAFTASPGASVVARWVVPVAAAFLACMYAASYPYGVREQNNRSLAGRHQRACVHFALALPGEECAANYPIWAFDYLLMAAPPLSKQGWLLPPLAESTSIPADFGQGAGSIESKEGASNWEFSGRLQGDPDAVILAVNENGVWRARAVLGPGRGWAWDPQVHWSASIAKARIAPGATLGVFGYRADAPQWTLFTQATLSP